MLEFYYEERQSLNALNMQLTNFTLQDQSPIHIEVAYNGQTYDLHNFAQFQGFRFDLKQESLRLSWDLNRSPDNPYSPYSGILELAFNGVTEFDVRPRDHEMPKSEDTTLDHIIVNSFFDGNEACAHSSSLSQELGAEINSLIIQFRGGQAFHICAESATITIS